MAGLLQDPDALLQEGGIAKKTEALNLSALSNELEKASASKAVADIIATDAKITRTSYGIDTSQPDQVRIP